MTWSGYSPAIPAIVYEREGKVCRPEVGTYREDDWVTEEYEGEPINDHDPLKSWKIMKNRMKFLVEEQYATDNTNIGKVKSFFWNFCMEFDFFITITIFEFQILDEFSKKIQNYIIPKNRRI